ncbi:MAG: hypothetical protein JWO77_160 [Ilumatobacteraceae bacterium]|nr:hypothetical protein [Ilumatobacteraceae bacterium]
MCAVLGSGVLSRVTDNGSTQEMKQMARSRSLTMDDFHTAWASTCQPHVSGDIEAVALFNPPGAVAGQAAAVAGRSAGGLLGRFAAGKAAARTTAPSSVPVPPVVVGAVTADAVVFFEVEASPDAAQIRLIAPWQSGSRAGLNLEVARKLMSERLTFRFADGTTFELDGMFTPKSKERPYQPFIDTLR